MTTLEFNKALYFSIVVYHLRGHLCKTANGHEELIADIYNVLKDNKKIILDCEGVTYFRVSTADEIFDLVDSEGGQLQVCEARHLSGAHQFKGDRPIQKFKSAVEKLGGGSEQNG